MAYPILKDNPVLNLDAETYEIIWNMDKDSPKYITSLAKTLFEIHSIPEKEVRENDLKIMKPSDLRPEIANNLQLVKSEIGISEQLKPATENGWIMMFYGQISPNLYMAIYMLGMY